LYCRDTGKEIELLFKEFKLQLKTLGTSNNLKESSSLAVVAVNSSKNKIQDSGISSRSRSRSKDKHKRISASKKLISVQKLKEKVLDIESTPSVHAKIEHITASSGKRGRVK
jgi:hypothetical protein